MIMLEERFRKAQTSMGAQKNTSFHSSVKDPGSDESVF
jgi:hypothetical protein